MLFAAESKIHVSLPAEPIFHIGSLPITNSMLVMLAAYAIVIALMFKTANALRTGRKSRLATAVHWMFEILLNTIEEVTGDKEKARRIAPLAITMFFSVLVGYWLGLLPIVGAVKWHGHELFRGGITDLNFTFALAIITMLTVQVYAIKQHGIFGNAKRYFINPLKDPAHSFEGILELIAEFSRGTALSLRLFGNVFAGEVLIAVIAFLSQWITPLSQPFFLAFELFIGFIQSYVFFMLTIVFISLGSAPVEHHKEDAEESVSTQTKEPVGLGSKA
ncbi:MAG: synthase subunit a [Candidatus Saccharibacteria bacterium]|nr:synthase subunit a [Candidatus Saccharibacteria bacterium]